MNRHRSPLLLVVAMLLALPAVAFGQTIVTVSCTGTPSTDGASLLSAYSGVSGASASSPYVVQPEPCLYDLGTSTLTAKNFVDLIGLGRNDTIITSQVDRTSAPNSGTITVPSGVDAEFANLTIRNTDTTACYAVRNASSDFVMDSVILEAFCDEDAVALFTVGSVHLNDGMLSAVTTGEEVVTARAVALEDNGGGSVVVDTFMSFGGEVCTDGFGAIIDGSDATLIGVHVTGDCQNATGFHLYGIANPSIGNSTADVFGGSTGTAVGVDVGHLVNSATFAQVFDTKLDVNGDGNAYGVRITKSASSIRLTDVISQVFNGTTRVGLQVSAGLATADHCNIEGPTNALVVASGATANIGASRLKGGASSVSGTATCVFTYDGAYSALGSTC